MLAKATSLYLWDFANIRIVIVSIFFVINCNDGYLQFSAVRTHQLEWLQTRMFWALSKEHSRTASFAPMIKMHVSTIQNVYSLLNRQLP